MQAPPLEQQQHAPRYSCGSSNRAWGPDLDAYLGCHPEELPAPGGGGGQRQHLVAAVKAAPECADAWRALLEHEEAHHGNITQQQQHQAAGGPADSGRVSLYHLYVHATKLVPRSKGEAYQQLWLGYARQAWPRGQDEARDIFKALKNQAIADGSAQMYYEWAVLEHSAGNVSKALGVIAKGLRAGAQPSSILEQLRGELQSGTFDLRTAATLTETITLDAGAVAARHALSTPAAPATAGLRPGTAGMASASSRPTGSVLGQLPPSATAAAAGAAGAAAHSTRAGGTMASCLKAPATTAAAAGHSEPHAVRAVTFAADVHDAPTEGHQHAHRADGHSGCLSVSSLSSRSTASGHDGTLPFSGSVVSYKSSTTESSGMEGAEEDTISCKVAGAPGSGAGSSSSRDAGAGAKPSTMPLSGVGGHTTPAAAGANTATLGLKRFGFKSRALRVGGAQEPALAAADPATAGQAVAQAAPHPSSAAAAGAEAGPPAFSAAAAQGAAAGGEVPDAAAAGRKRRAGSGSVPSPSTSPKMAAAVRDGQQCRVQLHGSAGQGMAAGPQHGGHGAGAGPRRGSGSSSSAEQQAEASQVQGHPRGSSTGMQPGQGGAASIDGDDDDSVPLVSSRLAARLAPNRGTPAPPGAKDRGAVAAGMGLWSSPVDGQLPSSLDTTPSEDIRAAGAPAAPSSAGGGTAGGGHGAPCRSALAGLQATHATEPHMARSHRDQQQQPQHGSSHDAAGRGRQGLPARASAAPPGAAAGADVSPLPTIVLPEVPAASSRHTAGGSSAAQASRAAAAGQPHGSSHTSGQQQQQQAAAREPLRPLQAHPQPAAPAQPPTAGAGAGGSKPHAAAKTASVETAAPAGSRPAQHKQQPLPPPQGHQQQQQHAAQQPMGAPPPQQPPPQPQPQPQRPVQQQQQQQPAADAAGGGRVRQERPKEDAQTVFVQGVRYHKLECVGRGGSSKVFKVMGPGCKIFALKRIRLAGRDPEAASGFIDEINLLQRLKDKPNIIQLVDSQVFVEEGLIYMVQEYGEIDLARLLAKHDAARRGRGAAGPGAADGIDENFIRLYWQQMLQAVCGVHEQRIVHSDLKPANFLLVEGALKLIDFGIAKAISGDTTSIARESQVGTLNYMSPEAILGGSNNILGGPAMKVGRPSDVWSLGCILYQMVYGRTPFADLPFLPKMHAICTPQHRISYPELANKDLLDVMRRCLDRDPKSRISLQELLEHPFLHPNRSRPQAPAPAAPPVLSEEQMKLLVAQVQAAGAAGVTDLDALTRELMTKLGAASLGGGGSSSGSSGSAAGSTTGVAKQPPPQQQQQQHTAPQQHVAPAAAAQGAAGGGSRSGHPSTATMPSQPTWR